MIFGGFQKLTLLDYPGKVACTVFTKGCNFRCPFCHNANLVNPDGQEQSIPSEEVLSYLRKRKGILEGICVSGGEPLLHDDLPDFLQEVKTLGYAVKLDTNGSFPDKLKELAKSGLIDYVAMDIKNSLQKYPVTAGCETLKLDRINESIDFLMQSSLHYEFRTTVVEELHTASDIKAIAKRIAGAQKYFLQNFVDSGNIIEKNLHSVNEETLELMKSAAAEFVKPAKIRGKN
ncbi:MAG: anaerobic ribonucleoside-triphosphate reductase activating protein [Clostridia bacterium]|nr:anaerobic ribonucleoside-triphosphate reductase activating protein [Clostridia bacterium]